MFWINYLLLCGQIGKTPNGLAKELGISSGTVTGWKKGKIPSESSLQKIADYFGIDKWDLLGQKNTATSSGDGNKQNLVVDERHAFVNSIFDQLTFENQVRAVNELQSLLRSQSTPGSVEE